MTVKFRIGLTIDAKTLFGMMSKMLPIEDLSVEEILDKKPTPAPQRIAHKPKYTRKPTKEFDATTGINAIVFAELKEGPKSLKALGDKLAAAGFSHNSASSRLMALRKRGLVTNPGDGTWKLT